MNSVTNELAGCARRSPSVPLLHDAAFVHQDDLVAEISGFGQIVRDENGRLLQSLKNLLQIFLQCCANEWIERTERLIEKKKLRRERRARA